MINLLSDYIWRSIPEEDTFTTSPGLVKKVDAAGRLLKYKGNTVVFVLDEVTKATLLELQNELYEAAAEVLAERLGAETFHMTLHDLVNGSEGEAGLEGWMQRIQPPVKALVQQWQNQEPLHMRATWMFNMVNTSIVLGLAPADEDSSRRLNELYCGLEKELTLGYGLTPHITLAYFKPGTYSAQEIAKLRSALRPVELEVTLSMQNLVFQEFSDMNHYVTV